MIRKLDLKDAEAMITCLKDSDVNYFMNIDGSKMVSTDCQEYIKKSWDDEKNYHFAIVDENDNWIGTISLKNIDKLAKQVEYASITSSSVHGKGYAFTATKEIIEYGFEKLGLNRIYLNVVDENIKANKFYQKVGFIFEGCFRKAICIKGRIYNLNWYSILKSDKKQIYKYKKET